MVHRPSRQADDGRKAGATYGLGPRWQSMGWAAAQAEVRRLQMRIAKAVQAKQPNKVRSLQWLLTHSWSAKVLAVRRVSRNKGSRTPGIDGVVWNTAAKKMRGVLSLQRRGYRAQPLRRVKVPKRKPGTFRNLGIPTMKDRAMQALYLLALEPVAELTADPNSYGFRLERACRDAIEQCFCALGNIHSAEWLLDADIKACFDWIDHTWLLTHIPLDRKVLREWLRSGVVEGGRLFPTRAGTPQGGIISPTLANMTLDGLEHAVKRSCPYGSCVNFVRYADDFIVTARTPELLRDRVIPALQAFLAERGLVLSPEKTQIVHIADGFDFLGQTLRKLRGKLNIRPTKDSIHRVLAGLRDVIRRRRGQRADRLVDRLNARLRGWCNYHRYVQSLRAFEYLDHQVYQALRRWVRRRHPRKSRRWIRQRYFPGDDWQFTATRRLADGRRVPVRLVRAAGTRLYRYFKVRGAASPFNPEYRAYFEARKVRAPMRAVTNPSRFVHACIAGSC